MCWASLVLDYICCGWVWWVSTDWSISDVRCFLSDCEGCSGSVLFWSVEFVSIAVVSGCALGMGMILQVVSMSSAMDCEAPCLSFVVCYWICFLHFHGGMVGTGSAMVPVVLFALWRSCSGVVSLCFVSFVMRPCAGWFWLFWPSSIGVFIPLSDVWFVCGYMLCFDKWWSGVFLCCVWLIHVIVSRLVFRSGGGWRYAWWYLPGGWMGCVCAWFVHSRVPLSSSRDGLRSLVAQVLICFLLSVGWP